MFSGGDVYYGPVVDGKPHGVGTLVRHKRRSGGSRRGRWDGGVHMGWESASATEEATRAFVDLFSDHDAPSALAAMVARRLPDLPPAVDRRDPEVKVRGPRSSGPWAGRSPVVAHAPPRVLRTSSRLYPNCRRRRARWWGRTRGSRRRRSWPTCSRPSRPWRGGCGDYVSAMHEYTRGLRRRLPPLGRRRPRLRAQRRQWPSRRPWCRSTGTSGGCVSARKGWWLRC